MAYWIDNADSYICSICGYECNNPNKEKYETDVCPNCGTKIDGGRTDEYIEKEVLMKETDRQRGEFISNKTIQFFPDTDVIPVRHGKWNNWEVLWKECSCCQYRTQKINAREYFFCPNCGAKMDLE